MADHQPKGMSSKNVYQEKFQQSKQGAGSKGYNSTENIKRVDESQLGAGGPEKRQTSLNKPQFNNLV